MTIDNLVLPPDSWLNPETELVSSIRSQETARKLQKALDTYNFKGKVLQSKIGYKLTLFYIDLYDGERLSSLISLEKDISRLMHVEHIRIIPSILGSGCCGIEIPNPKTGIIALRSVLYSDEFLNSCSKDKLIAGLIDPIGGVSLFNITSLPHLLVAGSTGSGKSILLHNVICSILFSHYSELDLVKFVLIDPKMSEFHIYKSLKGFIISSPDIDETIITKAENAVLILHSLCAELKKRYNMFERCAVSNIGEYHKMQAIDSSLETMPFIIVVIDELADLMLSSGRAIEAPIIQLAQQARAVGIHLIVATQRPSVDVIKGLIKSNFPARIALQVPTGVDSRVIIDRVGAEMLLRKGDLLFSKAGSMPIRLHCPFVEKTEIKKIIDLVNLSPKSGKYALPTQHINIQERVMNNNPDSVLNESIENPISNDLSENSNKPIVKEWSSTIYKLSVTMIGAIIPLLILFIIKMNFGSNSISTSDVSGAKNHNTASIDDANKTNKSDTEDIDEGEKKEDEADVVVSSLLPANQQKESMKDSNIGKADTSAKEKTAEKRKLPSTGDGKTSGENPQDYMNLYIQTLQMLSRNQ